MTAKKRTEPEFLPGGVVPAPVEVEVAAGEEALPVAESAPVVVLDVASPTEALDVLRRLHGEHPRVTVRALVTSRPTDQEVAESHAFDGARDGGRWRFTAASLDMAARVVGWAKADHSDPGEVRLS